MPDFVGAYHQHFNIIRASTPELLELAYRLRYQVYCVENQFEDATRWPDGREIDDDDDRSVHILLVHRRSGAVAGTARLILPQPGGRPLPMQRILHPAERAEFERLPLHRLGEVSRFAISKEFRRSRAEEYHPGTGYPHHASEPVPLEMRLMPHIVFGLLRGILRICRDYQIGILVALVEPALRRMLSQLGLDFERFGPLVEHHGLRQPSVAHLVDLLRGSRSRAGLLWEYWQEDAAPVIAAPPPSED